MKNIQLGYTLPESIAKKYKLRFYIAAKNLITITKYSGFDPEVGATTSNSVLERGYDRGTYPQARMYLIGANLNF
jgi:hypothetical protein